MAFYVVYVSTGVVYVVFNVVCVRTMSFLF